MMQIHWIVYVLFLLASLFSGLASHAQIPIEEGDPLNPSGIPVYAIFYGEKADRSSLANYNSAVAARDPSSYALKDSTQRPVVYFLGPVHGQEVEGLVGLINLISALHHGSGNMAVTLECSHGSISDRFPEPFVSFEDILDIQLILYDEILSFALEYGRDR